MLAHGIWEDKGSSLRKPLQTEWFIFNMRFANNFQVISYRANILFMDSSLYIV
jgi:hypothetical protein